MNVEAIARLLHDREGSLRGKAGHDGVGARP